MTRFERPESVAEAARLLAAGEWAVLAGGTAAWKAGPRKTAAWV